MKKTIIVIILSIFVLSTTCIAKTIQFEEKANLLKELGLFTGNDKGFDLDRPPSRVEAMVMLIRLLGKEKESLESNFTHPFTDVPIWADKQIGYLYENGLVSGIGNNLLGAKQMMNTRSYVTLMLRALGYNDSKGDFKWSTALKKATELNMLTEDEATNLSKKQFLRDDMVNLSYSALRISLKDESNTSLALKLVLDGIISKDVALSQGLIEEVPMIELTEAVKLTNMERIEQYPILTKDEISIKSKDMGFNRSELDPIVLRITVDKSKLPNAYSIIIMDKYAINKADWDDLMSLEKYWRLDNEDSVEYQFPSLFSSIGILYIVLDDDGNILGYTSL